MTKLAVGLRLPKSGQYRFIVNSDIDEEYKGVVTHVDGIKLISAPLAYTANKIIKKAKLEKEVVVYDSLLSEEYVKRIWKGVEKLCGESSPLILCSDYHVSTLPFYLKLKDEYTKAVVMDNVIDACVKGGRKLFYGYTNFLSHEGLQQNKFHSLTRWRPYPQCKRFQELGGNVYSSSNIGKGIREAVSENDIVVLDIVMRKFMDNCHSYYEQKNKDTKEFREKWKSISEVLEEKKESGTKFRMISFSEGGPNTEKAVLDFAFKHVISPMLDAVL